MKLSVLKSGLLKGASKALWGLGWLATAWIAPVDIGFKSTPVKTLTIKLNWKKAAALLVPFFVLHPLTTYMFPRGDEFLAREGLDPKIVEELAPGKKVYVRTDNLAGTLHAMGDKWGLIGVVTHYMRNISDETILAYAKNSPIRLPVLGKDVCTIYLKTRKSETGTVKKNIGKADIEVGISDAFRQGTSANRHHTILHELSHCSEGAAGSRLFNEAEADYKAIRIYAREKNKPELKRDFVLHAAYAKGGNSAIHDTALYIDMKLRGEEIPSAETLMKANSEAAVHFRIASRQRMLLPLDAVDPICHYSTFSPACRFDPATLGLSPLAQRRLDLYIEAVKVIESVKVRPAAKAATPNS